MRKWLTITGLLIAFTAGCAAQEQQTSGKKITITKAVADNFEGYKAWLTSMGGGYYAVTDDGIGSWGWGCPSNHCLPGPSSRSLAIKACEDHNPGHTCFIFAENQDIVVPYEVAP